MGLPPKPDALRERFIRAARELLDEPGGALDLRKVADRAGKSRTAPYLTFGRSEEGGGLAALRVAVAASGTEDLVRAARRAATRADDPEMQLREVGRTYVAFALRHPQLFRLMFGPEVSEAMREAAANPEPRPEAGELVRARAELEGLLREVVRRCQRVGALEPGETWPLVTGAWAIFHGVTTLLLDGQLETAGVARNPHQAAEFAARLLFPRAALPLTGMVMAFTRAQALKAGEGEASSLAAASPAPIADAPGLPELAAAAEWLLGAEGLPALRDRDDDASLADPDVRASPAVPDPDAPLADAVDHALALPDAGEEPPPPRHVRLRDGIVAETPSAYGAAWRSSGTPGSAEAAADLVRASLEREPSLRRARRSRAVVEGSRILWIDDRPELIVWERRMLGDLGAEVVNVGSTSEALEALMGARGRAPGWGFHLIVSDIARPDSRTAGLDALPLLRETAPGVPVLFYVGSVDPERGTPPGAFGIASQPAELLHLVLDALERTRA